MRSSTGRAIVLACLACVAVLLVAAVTLVARTDHARGVSSLQAHLADTGERVALSAAGRLDAADAVLRAAADAAGSAAAMPAAWHTRLQQSGMFSWQQVLVPSMDGVLAEGRRTVPLGARQRFEMGTGYTVAVVGEGPSGPQLFLVRSLGASDAGHLLVAELAPEWLWGALARPGRPLQSLVVDERGTRLAGAAEGVDEQVRRLFAGHGTGLLSWQGDGAPRIGSVHRIPLSSRLSVPALVVVATGTMPSWGSSLRRAMAMLWPGLVAALLLALLLAVAFAHRASRMLGVLRRSLVRLGEAGVTMPRPPAALPEWREVADAFNRTATQLAEQRRMLCALVDIDELLIGAIDVEQVLDRVLVRMRELMRARNVSLMLVDASVSGHGRLFSVGLDATLGINRVVLDPAMGQTLLESHSGLTIMRCEEERHSFLLPLRDSGTEFFWVWPLLPAQRLAAVLAVGYVEPPAQGAQVAHYGTLCVRRLSVALATSTRSEQLYRQAHFDPLTQLPNRLLFRDRLEQELRACEDATGRGALLYIDLDHFKRINDSMGHEAGDQLLVIVAQRLRGCVKEGDTVARLAGDEFTVILRNVGEPGVAATAAERIIQALQAPVSLGGKDHVVRASVGITLFPDDASASEELMRNADLAMYQAKAQGRGAAVFYQPQLARRLAGVVDSGLHRALRRHEFSLLFQPQYSVRDGSLQGVEALLRWQTQRDGLRTPGEVIAAAEESGLIVDLGGWVLEAACQQVERWLVDGLAVPHVAVNVSVRQLHDADFAASLQRLMDRYGVPGGIIELELTEAALSDPEAQDSVEALSQMGVGLILDDFGTGHAALNSLRRHPVRMMKIDRSFVDRVEDDAGAMALVGTLIAMAHGMGKQVVAEGVETMQQLAFLREHGCDIAQGYYLARPMAATSMTELLVRSMDGEQANEHIARA